MPFEIVSKLSLIALVCLVRFSVSQNNFLIQPWIDTISVPDVTPSTIPIYSSDVVPVNNTFNRLISATVNEVVPFVNTGSALLVVGPSNTGTYTIGGALGLVQYKFAGVSLYWNLELGRSGTTLDEDSKPLEAITRYYNTNYTPKTASNYRDGWFLEVRRVNVVEGAPDNQNFTDFGEKVRQVSAAGSQSTVSGANVSWLFPNQVVDLEYCYPGSYPTSNGGQTYSAIICMVTDDEKRTISQKQFYQSFGVLRNNSGKPYSNVKKLYKASPGTPIGGFGAIVIGYPLT